MEREVIERLYGWMKGKINFPHSIELAPTLRCNLNCLFCWRYGKGRIKSEELTTEEYSRIIRESASMGVKEIRIIGGGEPLMRKDIIAIMKEIKKFGIHGYVCTNGTLFSRERIERLVRMGWDHVKISIHGSNAKTHDKLVGKDGAFKKSVSALKTFVQMRRKFGTKKPRLEIGLVLVNRNYKEVPKLFELANNIGIESIFIEPITVYTPMGEKLVLNEHQSKEFVEIAKSVFKEFNDLETNINFFFETKAHEYTGHMDELILKASTSEHQNKFLNAACYEPWYRMGIRVDGTVCPCGFYDVGSKENVREKNLREIWMGEYFQERRKQILEGRLPVHCRKCCTTLVRNTLMIRRLLIQRMERNKVT